MEKSQLEQQAKVLVHEYLTKKKQKPSAIARMLGLSPSRITQLFNNPGMLSDEVLLMIINRLKPKTTFNYVSTSNFNTIQSICAETHKKHRLVALLAYPGAGKTTGLDEYFRNTANVYYLEVKKSMNRKQFLRQILLALGIDFDGSIYDILETVSYELNTRQNPLLIIDEVSRLNQHYLLDLHDIRNATFNNAGIILSGCPYFEKDLDAAVIKQKQGMPEIRSRIQAIYDLYPPSKEEMKAICIANNVTDPETIKQFQKLKDFRELYNAIVNETDAEGE